MHVQNNYLVQILGKHVVFCFSLNLNALSVGLWGPCLSGFSPYLWPYVILFSTSFFFFSQDSHLLSTNQVSCTLGIENGKKDPRPSGASTSANKCIKTLRASSHFLTARVIHATRKVISKFPPLCSSSPWFGYQWPNCQPLSIFVYFNLWNSYSLVPMTQLFSVLN